MANVKKRLSLQLNNLQNTMKMKTIVSSLICFLMLMPLRAQEFNEYFMDKTLRVDYLFVGNASQQSVCVDELSSLPTWAGRKHHLDELPLQGNGQIVMRDAASGTIIYKTSFSSLFQEWLSTDEAKTTTKGFENTFLLPYPKRSVEVEITLLDSRRNIQAKLTHHVDPTDILIHAKGISHITPHKYLQKNGDPARCIDVAILA